MAAMDRDAMSAMFESVLAEYGLDPVECREGDEWWRFSPDSLSMQGGVHRREFRVLCALTEIDSEVDIEDVYTSIAGRNAALPLGALAVFSEADNYLYVRSERAFTDLSVEVIKAMIDACMALARSPTAQSLRSKYRVW